MAAATLEWWTLLRTLALFNLAAWALAAWALHRGRGRWPAAAWQTRRALLWLSAVYVAGCAWRSWWPVFDIERQALVDSPLSAVVFGRSVATVAELCFAAQWALLLREVSLVVGDRRGLLVSRAVLPLIGVAELCSWYSVLTTSNLGHVIEESLWGGCAALLVASLVILWPHVAGPARGWLAACCAAGCVYVLYMFGVDVPMYGARWLDDEAQGRGSLGLLQGLVDASTRWVVRHDWEAWRAEVTWMTLYFSVAVWLSIALVHTPLVQAATRRAGAAA